MKYKYDILYSIVNKYTYYNFILNFDVLNNKEMMMFKFILNYILAFNS